MKFLGKLISSVKGKKNASSGGDSLPSELRDFERRIGYRFRNPRLLMDALTHPSFHQRNKDKPNNQRLEFLGDSILGAILAENLYLSQPDADEGILSQAKAALARGSSLAKVARKLKLGSFLRMSPSEKRNRGNERESTLEDGLEALIGAIFLDGGLEATREKVLLWLGKLDLTLDQDQDEMNPKGRLQELVQASRPGESIRYKVERESGPPHKKRFFMSVMIGKKNFGRGEGKSKKEAEEQAARQALKKLD